jgi:hypothetical protein
VKPGDVITTKRFYPFYSTSSFRDALHDVPPGTTGMILSVELNKIQILTSIGIGWVGEHILKNHGTR